MPQAVPRQPLLALLACNEEDRFTEYLYHLLGWDDVLSELLNLCGASGVKCNVVEVSIRNFVAGSYPDLAIQGPDQKRPPQAPPFRAGEKAALGFKPL